MTALPSLLIVGCQQSLAQSGSFLDRAEQFCEAWRSSKVLAVLCRVVPGAARSISVPDPTVSLLFPRPCLVQAAGTLLSASAAAEVSGAGTPGSLRAAVGSLALCQRGARDGPLMGLGGLSAAEGAAEDFHTLGQPVTVTSLPLAGRDTTSAAALKENNSSSSVLPAPAARRSWLQKRRGRVLSAAMCGRTRPV